MTECILLKRDGSFIKVNDWSKTISMVFTEWSQHADYYEVYMYKTNIKQNRLNQTGQVTTSTIYDSGLGDYINYNTIFLNIEYKTGSYSYSKTVTISKGTDLREPIIIFNNNSGSAGTVWLAISREAITSSVDNLTWYPIEIQPFKGNISGTYDITFKIIGVSNNLYLIHDS